MFQARCPNCGTLNHVPTEQPSASVCCFACRHVFPATPQPSASVPHPVGSTVPSPTPPRPPVYPAGYPSTSHSPQSTPQSVPVTTVPPQPSPPPGSIQGSPQAAIGPQSTAGGHRQVGQSDAGPRESASGGLTLILVLLAALFVLLGATVVVVLLITQGDLPVTGRTSGRRAGAGHRENGEYSIAQERTEAVWADAVGKSLEIDRASIKIDRVEWGHVRGRDSHGTIITSDDPYLSIIVTVRNRARSPILYQSWHSGPHPAVLMDETNREFGRFNVPRFKAIEWHIPDEKVERGQRAADRLIFSIPNDVKHDSVAAFRLELPAEAVERQGVFRFRIPVEMIEGF